MGGPLSERTGLSLNKPMERQRTPVFDSADTGSNPIGRAPVASEDSPSDELIRAWEPARIEPKWQQGWRSADCFEVPPEADSREDAYIFTSLPFTSGSIHVGHVRSYALSDVCARFRRARGDAVLFSLGFDTFGLPSELGAIDRKQPVAEWVAECIASMREQLDRLGFSFDWSRSYATSEPDLYRWSQWVFLVLHEADLIFRRDAFIEWCDSCRSALAATQVDDGCCWRCHQPIRMRRKPQWYLRLSVYNEENEAQLATLPWNAAAIAAQRSLLGRVDGVEFEAHSPLGSELTVFTTHPDLIGEAAFIALSPRHPEIDDWIDDDTRGRLQGELAGPGWTDPAPDAPAFVDSEVRLQIPGLDRLLPLVITPFVERSYGPTAVLGIPSASRADAAIDAAIAAPPPMAWRLERKLFQKRPSVRYRASDFSISRQRSWGTPVPIIHCESCGEVPVPAENLPVELPSPLSVNGTGDPLAEDTDFVCCACPACGEDARRATETLDGHVDMFLIYLAAAVPPEARDKSLVSHPEAQRWLPVAQTIRGSDTGGFLLDERTVAKALRDLGLLEGLADGEPYGPTLMHGLVRLDGRKMSKHLDNAVDPDSLVEEFGADAVRFAVLYAAAPEKDFNWDPTVLRYSAGFLRRLWEFAEPRLSNLPESGVVAMIEPSSGPRRRLLRWCGTATVRMIENYEALQLQRATRNAMILLDRIEAFDRKARGENDDMPPVDHGAIAAALLLLVRLLNPICPHVTEELWQRAGCEELLAETKWPEARTPAWLV